MNTSRSRRWVEAASAVGLRAESRGIAFDTTKMLATGAAGGRELDITVGECSHEARFLHADVSIAAWPA